MHLSSLSFRTGGRCELSFQKPQGWLRATWTGQIGTEEALRGGQNYLQQVGPLHCLYLLNDNTGLHGPWFDSLEWLRTIWLPQAQRMGLRYVAHVVQADTHTDILSQRNLPGLLREVEFQLFDEVIDAEDWLRNCQQPLTRAGQFKAASLLTAAHSSSLVARQPNYQSQPGLSQQADGQNASFS